MSKGHDRDFIGLYRAILADYLVYHPNYRLGSERDLSRLISLKEKMGERVFTLLLPALGKVLDRALDDGCLARTGLPLSRSINTRTVIPRLFQGLWLQLFSLDGCLKQDIDPVDIFFLRTLLYVGKRVTGSSGLARDNLKLRCPNDVVFTATKEFFDVEAQLPPPSPHWRGDGSSLLSNHIGSFRDLYDERGDQPALFRDERSRDDAYLLDLVSKVADRIAVAIGDYVPSDYRFRHGPGATSESQRGGAYKYAFPSWSSRLQRVFPFDVFGLPNTSILGTDYDVSALLSNYESASRLIAVPKSQKTPRLIAAEPTAHQWCQQNIRDFLDDRIRHTFLGQSIDFRRQDLSREDALAASKSGDRATVDLSSASDRLSCWVVERFFRKNIPLLEALISSRTRYLRNEIDVKMPKLIELRKFASMGSALTFPIQSIVFYGLCVAAGMAATRNHRMREIGQQVRVYGDDLIVPVSWMPFVERIFTMMHLKINMSKTFRNGKFRESCGMDAFDGHDVTPVYLSSFYEESNTSTLMSIVEVSNNFLRRWLVNTSAWAESSIPRKIRKLVPYVSTSAGAFGLATFSGYHSTSRKRWNTDLQRTDVRILQFVPKKANGLRYEGFENLLQFFTEDPVGKLFDSWQSGRFQRPTDQLVRRWVPLELLSGGRAT